MKKTTASFLVLSLLLPLSLAGCKARGKLDPDATKFFEQLKGPDVKGMDATTLESAKQAETAGNYKRAAQMYKQLVDSRPENEAYQLSYADSLRRGEQCNNAMPVYQALIDKNPKNLDAMEGKGFCQMNFGEAKEASRTFEGVLAIDGKRWRTLNATGILFASKGKIKEAIGYFEAAQAASESQTAVLNNLGIAYMLDKRYDNAIEILGRGVRKLPSNSPDVERLDMNLALAYALAGDMTRSEEMLRKHLPEEATYNNLGYFAKLRSDQQLAKDYLNMALTKSPTYYKRAWENLEQVKAQ